MDDEHRAFLQGEGHDEEIQKLHIRLTELQAQEKAEVERLAFINSAWQARLKPHEEALSRMRESVHLLELEIMQKEHGHEEVEAGHGPACLSFVAGHSFSCLCSLVIAANLVVMLIELKGIKSKSLSMSDNAFLAWYILELALKFAYYEKHLLIGSLSVVWWNWLDLVIVLSGVVDQWVMPLMDAQKIGFDLSSLRCLRLLRLFRIARALKLLKILFQSDLSWTEDPRFETFMMVVIVINAVVMWLELDYPGILWVYMEHSLLAMFTFELVVRIAWHGRAYFTHGDWGWHCLDFTIVTLGVLEQWMMPIVFAVESLVFEHSANRNDAAARVGRLLRIVRVARVLRLARLLHDVKPLYKLINGVVAALQAISWVMVLTGLFLYSASIVFTTLVGQGFIFEGPAPEEAKEYYGSVFRTFLSLFKLMNDDQSMVEPIVDTVGGQLMFYVFMMLSNWIALAVLTSVVSDHMMAASREHDDIAKAELARQQKASTEGRLTAIFQQIDSDNTGTIDKTEMETMLADDDLRAELSAATGLEITDLIEILHCVNYTNEEGKQVLLYRQFAHMLQDQSYAAKERSIFKLMESLRSFEYRQEKRLNAALLAIGMKAEEIAKLPSLVREMDQLRVLQGSPAANLARKLTQSH
eukprot:TRINITY_DN13310_c0_g2_i1.p1 TRINITY_DN13310_c0_g2~~TRINITY_DN13310_c0_g2_i1.p1  ORF type:complete len:656 (-),score=120.71 TRINITY_DN13310_c0_g2_i1:468-2390(-)